MSQTDQKDEPNSSTGNRSSAPSDASDPSAPDTAAAKSGPDVRARIAMSVLKWSGIGLGGLAIVAVLSAAIVDIQAGKFQALQQTLERLLLSYVPLVGTWVGTVLAYYFARENFEAASEQTNKLLNQTLSERLTSIRVIDVMTRWESIVGVLDKSADKDKKLQGPNSVREQIRAGATRLVVTDKKKVVAVIHASTLSDFLLRAADDQARNALTLSALLSDRDVKQVIERIAFVADTATMDDAKSAMERVSGTADVFITQGGNPEEQPIGWITNTDVAKHSQYVKGR